MTADQELVFKTIKANLSAFKGAKSLVFLAIASKMDGKREAYFEHYRQLSSKTGYSIALCRKAVNDLCATRIDGLPVLHKTGLGRSGSSFYVLPCWLSPEAEALRQIIGKEQAAAYRILRCSRR